MDLEEKTDRPDKTYKIVSNSVKIKGIIWNRGNPEKCRKDSIPFRSNM
jgi:hypothetical protein